MAVFHSTPQCEHWASKKTYTVRALMGEPTVKPLASLAIAVMETGALADLPALSAPLVTVESLHPASKRLAETSAAGKIFNRDLNVMAIELNRPGRGVKAQRQALKKTARGCKAYRVSEFDILPALKDGDSCCQTRMSARGNVPCGVHVAVVYRCAAASPLPYSKPF